MMAIEKLTRGTGDEVKEVNFRVNRGEVWMANFGEINVLGSEQRGYRPVVIIQNDIGNRCSTTTIVASITTQDKKHIPTHAYIELKKDSIVMLEQVKTISKIRLNKKVGVLSEEEMENIDECIKISMGIN